MKKEQRLDRTVSLIEQALVSCGHDFATTNVRACLLGALREAGHIAKKRERRQGNAMQEAATKAVQNYEKWWKQIEENVRKAAAKKEPEPTPELEEES